VGGYVEARGVDLFELAKEKRLEGTIAKGKASIHQPGKHSADWLKIKSRPTEPKYVGLPHPNAGSDLVLQFVTSRDVFLEFKAFVTVTAR
jgi:ATP-dependent DNA ligase